MSEIGSEDCVRVKLLFFAKARELAGIESASIVCKREILVAELINAIRNKFNLEEINFSFVLAINQLYYDNLEERLELHTDDEIAIIPPVSGG